MRTEPENGVENSVDDDEEYPDEPDQNGGHHQLRRAVLNAEDVAERDHRERPDDEREPEYDGNRGDRLDEPRAPRVEESLFVGNCRLLRGECFEVARA